MPNLSSLGCLAAELESVTDAGRTDGRRTPGENSANPGFASLVLGPELSNKAEFKPQPIKLIFGLQLDLLFRNQFL